MKYLIVTICILSTLAQAVESDTPGCTVDCSAADHVIRACQDLVDAQNAKLAHQDQAIKELEDMVIEEKAKEAAIPWWAYLSIGIASGAVGGVPGLVIGVLGVVGGVVKEELR